MKQVLTIAGSDPGGGAGIQADLKTFAALGIYGLSALTAATVQNTLGVTRVFPMPPDLIHDQIEAVLADMGADAVKIGMLYDEGAILAVIRALKNFQGPIVLDPVMQAKGGTALMSKEAVFSLKQLCKRVLLVTPNALEASALGNFTAKNILFKGGHTRKPDLLVSEQGTSQEFETQWIDTPHTHGTGCTLSSAIAAHLALGASLTSAIRLSKTYVEKAISAGTLLNIGKGQGPLHHFWR